MESSTFAQKHHKNCMTAVDNIVNDSSCMRCFTYSIQISCDGIYDILKTVPKHKHKSLTEIN